MIPFHGAFSADDLLATLHALSPDAFFLQIGAMDGVTYDPIHSLVVSRNWRGLLVEPVPDIFERLKKNYSLKTGLTFANVAITDFEGEIEITRMDPKVVEDGLLAPGALGISTIMPEHSAFAKALRAPEHQALVEKYSLTISVPCMRLQTLLTNNGVAQIDLLVIDTEGADWMIARQLCLETYHPKIVYLEYNHLTSYEQLACAKHFQNYGYRTYIDKNNGENFLAVKA